jgi:serpin B
MMKKMMAFIGFALLTASSCNESDEPVVESEPFSLKSAEIIEQAAAFNWEMFKSVNDLAEPGDNVVVSPISIMQAFGMAINGATGDNLEEMLSVMGFANSEGLNEACKNIRGALATADPKVAMEIANSAWYRDDFSINEAFFDALRTYYAARVSGLDFDNTDQAKQIMNDWVKDATRGKIPSIIDRIEKSHILFLINAVYFNGEWSSRFDKSKTTDAPFFLADGASVNVKMMQQKEDFQFYSGENYSALRLPYGDKSFAMTLILPEGSEDVNGLVNNLGNGLWDQLVEPVSESEVDVYLPRFKVECTFDLIPALKAVGMERAFYDVYGFRNIADDDIIISDVRHKTFIEVDERGTEAAAVTSIGFELSSMPMVHVFRVDRPFVFVISEMETGAILFAGKVENPL